MLFSPGAEGTKRLSLTVKSDYDVWYAPESLKVCSSMWYTAGIGKLQLTLRKTGSTGGSANVKFKNVGGTDVKNITNGCWVDGGDAFPSNAVAPSGELTGTWGIPAAGSNSYTLNGLMTSFNIGAVPTGGAAFGPGAQLALIVKAHAGDATDVAQILDLSVEVCYRVLHPPTAPPTPPVLPPSPPPPSQPPAPPRRRRRRRRHRRRRPRRRRSRRRRRRSFRPTCPPARRDATAASEPAVARAAAAPSAAVASAAVALVHAAAAVASRRRRTRRRRRRRSRRRRRHRRPAAAGAEYRRRHRRCRCRRHRRRRSARH